MEKELRSVEALRKLPIGMENFVEIRRNNFYYVDKTELIEQLVEKWSEVSLFTRPRRFGKTLNMSMLRTFLRWEQRRIYLMNRLGLPMKKYKKC